MTNIDTNVQRELTDSELEMVLGACGYPAMPVLVGHKADISNGGAGGGSSGGNGNGFGNTSNTSGGVSININLSI